MGLRAPSDGDGDGDAVAGDFVHTLAPRVGTRHDPAFPRLALTAAAHSTILQMISPVIVARKDDPHNLIGDRYGVRG